MTVVLNNSLIPQSQINVSNDIEWGLVDFNWRHSVIFGTCEWTIIQLSVLLTVSNTSKNKKEKVPSFFEYLRNVHNQGCVKINM